MFIYATYILLLLNVNMDVLSQDLVSAIGTIWIVSRKKRDPVSTEPLCTETCLSLDVTSIIGAQEHAASSHATKRVQCRFSSKKRL